MNDNVFCFLGFQLFTLTSRKLSFLQGDLSLAKELEKETTYEEICAEMKKRSEGDMKGFLGYTDEALVSTDFETCPISCTFDAKAGIMLDPTFVKVVCWYDNEWGYSCRVVDLIKHMAAEDAKA